MRHRVVVLASAGAIAETRLAAGRRRIRRAFVIRIRPGNDHTAHAVLPIALLQRRTRFARIGARFAAAYPVNAEIGRAVRADRTRQTIGLRGASSSRTNTRLAVRTIDASLTNVAILASRSATIDVRLGAVLGLVVTLRVRANAGTCGTNAALAIIGARAGTAVTTLFPFIDTNATAIDIRFRAVFLAVRARGRLASPRCAHVTRAVRRHHAGLHWTAFRRTAAPAIDVCFRSILDAVRAARRSALPSGAELADAIGGGHALLVGVTTPRTDGSAAIDVRFLSIGRHVRTRRRRTFQIRSANLFFAIRTAVASLANFASLALATAAIDIGFRGVFRAVITRRSLANVVSARNTLTIVRRVASLHVHAEFCRATRFTAIGVTLLPILHAVRARGSSARPVDTANG